MQVFGIIHLLPLVIPWNILLTNWNFNIPIIFSTHLSESERVRASQSESERFRACDFFACIFLLYKWKCMPRIFLFWKKKCVVISFNSDATLTNTTMIVSAIYLLLYSKTRRARHFSLSLCHNTVWFIVQEAAACLGTHARTHTQTHTLSFFLSWVWRPNLITGLSGWRAPD